MQAKKIPRSAARYFRAVTVILGIVLLALAFVTSTRGDMKNSEERLADTVNYIRQQCAAYSSLNRASETKSLMRIVQSVQQIERDIAAQRAADSAWAPEEAALKEYAENAYLSGVLLLRADGTAESSWCESEEEIRALRSELQKQVLLDVAEHPQKSYAVRVECEDGSYMDVASCGSADGEYVLVAYYHTPVEYVQSYGLSFQNLLDGYSLENDGTIVVTDGDRVVASNNDSLIGKSSDDVPVLLYIREKAINDKLVHVNNELGPINQIFGMIDRGRDYYVYAYMAERSVFGSTPRKLLFAAIGYALVLLLVQYAKWKTERGYRDEQLRREQAYQEKLKEAAQRAESANVAKTEFLQRMSHDIRTPINGIRGMVEIGNHYPADEAKQAECRKKIWDASGLLLELVNEVLDMGKLESGEVVLEERPFHMPALLDEIVDTQTCSAAERGITIKHTERVLPHPDLIGSPLHVKRLLMNLLSNAVKYNKDNGSITLGCREVRGSGKTVWVEFTCADTGIGMSKEFQQHLFEPFTQENSSARSTYGGTGLGMSITKSLVDKMGGTIEFESEQGVGTTFCVTIPFEIDENAVPQVAQEQGGDISIEGMRLLIAEDNELNMEIATFLLENAGALLTRAENGQQAVDLFASSGPGEYDAILMDVMMPVLDGYAATRAIRALDRADAKTVPVIAMTANAFPEDRKKAIDAGMNEHLTKPLDPVPLLKTLKKYMKQ